MNERIKELYKQTTGKDWAYDFDPEMAEKFAELIVRECADIAKHHVMNISTYADAEFVEEQIGKHFGVEE
jgi:hypothetical protein